MIDGHDILTHSRMDCFKSCPRKHYYKYILGIRKERDGDALRFGSAFHDGLEMQAAGKKQAEWVQAIRDRYAKFPGWANTDELRHKLWMEGEIIVRMLIAYEWRWSEDGCEIVENEQVFKVPLVRLCRTRNLFWFVGGKIDKIVRRSDGSLRIREHKTTGYSIAPGADYWKRCRIDHQISLYTLVSRILNKAVEGIEYDAIQKPKISVRKGETDAEFLNRLLDDCYKRPDFYFARQDVARTEQDMAEYADELGQISEMMTFAVNFRLDYRHTAACMEPYRCEYLDVCHGLLDLESVPEWFRRVTNLHEELA